MAVPVQAVTALRGEHVECLQQALLAAFDRPELEQLVRFEWGQRLATIVPVENRSETQVVHALVEWAIATPGIGLHGLLAAAARRNAANPELQALTREWVGLTFSGKAICPYPGMTPYGEADSAHFFGRKAEIAEALQLLRLHPFLAIIGPSGSGKSSLAGAGIIPAMRRSTLFAGQPLETLRLRPGAAPLAALAATCGVTPGAPDKLPADLPADLPAAARVRPGILFIDQFEECFTLAAQDEARTFQELVRRLVGTPALYVLLTVRADFYPELMNGPLWDEIRVHRLEIVPLRGEALAAAIVEPAAAQGVTVEPGLVTSIVADAAGEPGILPFVQETLVLLWHQSDAPQLRLRDYAELAHDGRTGLAAAMARRADQVYNAFAPASQAVARRLLIRLVQFTEGRPATRRQQREADLGAEGDDPKLFSDVLTQLVQQRLLTSDLDSQTQERKIDIAHEALLSGWPAIGEWIRSRREAEQARRRLEDKAAEWLRLEKAGAWLDRAELAEADAWLKQYGAELGVTPALRALTRESARRLRRTRWAVQGTLLTSSLVLIPVLVLAIILARDFGFVLYGNRDWQPFGPYRGKLETVSTVRLPGCNFIALGHADYGVAWTCDAQTWSEWRNQGLTPVQPDRTARATAAAAGSTAQPVYLPVRAIALDPQDAEARYITLKNYGLWRWLAASSRWQRIGNDEPLLPDSTGAAAPIAAYGRQLLYVGDDFSLYGSRDGGEQWSDLSAESKAPTGPFYSVLFDAAGQPYIAGEGGVWRGEGSYPWTWAHIIAESAERISLAGANYIVLSGKPNGDAEFAFVRCYTTDGVGVGEWSQVPTTSWLLNWFTPNSVQDLDGHPANPHVAYVTDQEGAVYEYRCAGGWRKIGQVGILDWPVQVSLWQDAAGEWQLLWLQRESGLQRMRAS